MHACLTVLIALVGLGPGDGARAELTALVGAWRIHEPSLLEVDYHVVEFEPGFTSNGDYRRMSWGPEFEWLSRPLDELHCLRGPEGAEPQVPIRQANTRPLEPRDKVPMSAVAWARECRAERAILSLTLHRGEDLGAVLRIMRERVPEAAFLDKSSVVPLLAESPVAIAGVRYEVPGVGLLGAIEAASSIEAVREVYWWLPTAHPDLELSGLSGCAPERGKVLGGSEGP